VKEGDENMKFSLQSDIRKKYQKKKQYLMHLQIREEYIKGYGVMVRINFVLFLWFGLVMREYPAVLGTLDFSFTVLFTLFYFFVKPKMLRGEIPAYYRRNYEDIKYAIWVMNFFVQGGIIRFFVLVLYYGITFYLVRDDKYEWEEYKEIVLNMLINPTVSVVAIVMSILFVYLFFYQEKYTTIRDYSNRIVELCSFSHCTEREAFHQFIQLRDYQLGLESLSRVKYDGAFASMSENSVDSQPQSRRGTVEKEKQKDKNNIVRRQARR
jgi:hypothetical protein